MTKAKYTEDGIRRIVDELDRNDSLDYESLASEYRFVLYWAGRYLKENEELKKKLKDIKRRALINSTRRIYREEQIDWTYMQANHRGLHAAASKVYKNGKSPWRLLVEDAGLEYYNKKDAKKKEKLEEIVESEKFPYALAVLQSRARKLNDRAFAVTNLEPRLAEKVKSILECVLDVQAYYRTIEYRTGVIKKAHRVVLWDTALMDVLREATENNTKIPSFVASEKQRQNYIRGFLDSKACITFSPHYVKKHDKVIKYPRIVVTKNNPQLLDSFARLLRKECVEPATNEEVLSVQNYIGIRRVIKAGLITEEYKLGILRRLYQELKEHYEVA